MNTEKMTGKTIVITGSGSGMGAAMAKEFASRDLMYHKKLFRLKVRVRFLHNSAHLLHCQVF